MEYSSGREALANETLAIFDLDGTLTRGDSLLPFLLFICGPYRFLLRLPKAMLPLIGFVLHLLSRDRAKERILAAFLGGMPVAEFHDRAQAFAASCLPAMMRPSALRRLAWHGEQGHRCVLLSASLSVYVLPWARANGFADVLATKMEVGPSGRLTGLLDGGNCQGIQKLRRLEEHFGDLTRFDAIYGYGDSRDDRHFLDRCTQAEYRPFRDDRDSHPSDARKNQLKELLRLMRPHQWLKNGFVLVGLIFGHGWNSPALMVSALLATAAFCLASSAVYVFNDLVDLDSDRCHPRKRTRPLAAGRVTSEAATKLGLLLLAGSAVLALMASKTVPLLIGAYLAINVAYSLALKDVVILDVFIIAGGFMLRILAGTLGIGIPPSQWLLFCGFLLTLFLGFTKRRAETLVLAEGAAAHRPSLAAYQGDMLDKVIGICASCVIMSYSLYALHPSTISIHGTANLLYTVPFVIYGLFRYLHLLHAKHNGTDTSDDLIRDPHLLITVLFWGLATTLLIAFF